MLFSRMRPAARPLHAPGVGPLPRGEALSRKQVCTLRESDPPLRPSGSLALGLTAIPEPIKLAHEPLLRPVLNEPRADRDDPAHHRRDREPPRPLQHRSVGLTDRPNTLRPSPGDDRQHRHRDTDQRERQRHASSPRGLEPRLGPRRTRHAPAFAHDVTTRTTQKPSTPGARARRLDADMHRALGRHAANATLASSARPAGTITSIGRCGPKN